MGSVRISLIVSLLTLSISAGAEDQELLWCEGQASMSPLCQEFKEALFVRAEAENLLSMLSEIKNPPWSGEPDYEATFVETKSFIEKGQRLFDDEYFGSSTKPYGFAILGLNSLRLFLDEKIFLERQIVENFSVTLEFKEAILGAQRLEWWAKEESSSLIQRIESVALDWQRFEKIDKLLSMGLYDDVVSLRGKVETDAYKIKIAEVDLMIEKNKRNLRTSRLVSRGYQALDQGDFPEAISFFSQATKIEPGNLSAAEGRLEAEKGIKGKTIEKVKTSLMNSLAIENYIGALNSLQELEALDPSFRKGNQELLLSELIEIEAKLDMFENQLVSLNSTRFRKSLENFLNDMKEFSSIDLGNRISTKYQRLVTRYKQLKTKIEWLITSDDEATVFIKPGGRLGNFSEMRIKLVPGTYQLIARCVGRKEVVRDMTVGSEISPAGARINCVGG